MRARARLYGVLARAHHARAVAPRHTSASARVRLFAHLEMMLLPCPSVCSCVCSDRDRDAKPKAADAGDGGLRGGFASDMDRANSDTEEEGSAFGRAAGDAVPSTGGMFDALGGASDGKTAGVEATDTEEAGGALGGSARDIDSETAEMQEEGSAFGRGQPGPQTARHGSPSHHHELPIHATGANATPPVLLIEPDNSADGASAQHISLVPAPRRAPELSAARAAWNAQASLPTVRLPGARQAAWHRKNGERRRWGSREGRGHSVVQRRGHCHRTTADPGTSHAASTGAIATLPE